MTGRDLPACTVAIIAAGTLAPQPAETAEAAPAKGRIQGEIAPPGLVTKVSAIDRDVKQKAIAREVAVKEFPGEVSLDGKSYEIDVAGPGPFDLHVELADGRIVEGADLRMSRQCQGGKRLTAGDRDRIVGVVEKMRTWSNVKETLAIEGAEERAKALVRLVRTRPTSYDGRYGEPVAVVRWEIWNFRKYTGSWRRESKVKVLRRFLMPKRELRELPWQFDPALGGVDVRPGETTRRDLDFMPRAHADTPTESAKPPPEAPPGFARKPHFRTVRAGAR